MSTVAKIETLKHALMIWGDVGRMRNLIAPLDFTAIQI